MAFIQLKIKILSLFWCCEAELLPVVLLLPSIFHVLVLQYGTVKVLCLLSLLLWRLIQKLGIREAQCVPLTRLVQLESVASIYCSVFHSACLGLVTCFHLISSSSGNRGNTPCCFCILSCAQCAFSCFPHGQVHFVLLMLDNNSPYMPSVSTVIKDCSCYSCSVWYVQGISTGIMLQ